MAEKIKIGIITDCISGVELAVKFSELGVAVSVCGYSKNSSADIKALYKAYNEVSAPGAQELLFDPEALLLSLKPPRTVLLVCKNFDREELKSFMDKLDKGDTLIDCCDMNYKESAIISKQFARQYINYLGTGLVYTTEMFFSKPSFMFSGDKGVYENIKPVFSDISPFVKKYSCAAYVGPDGAGQFVKMVCNAIYYTFLELISETIFLLNKGAGMDNLTIGDILTDFNSGETASFLLDTAADVIKRKDAKTGRYISDMVLDRVEYSNKDIWIGKSAFDLECPMPTVLTSIEMRFMSSDISRRIASSQIINNVSAEVIGAKDRKAFVETCRKALYLGMICCVDQCFSLLKSASQKYKWNLNYAHIAACLYGGTFVQSAVLLKAMSAFETQGKAESLMLCEPFGSLVKDYFPEVRSLSGYIIKNGWPCNAINSIIGYVDAVRYRRLPTAPVQLLRDCIADTGFERIDDTGIFYGDWSDINTVETKKR